jgi:hypothetical protein
VTALFVIWDRLFRNAPAAFIVARPVSPGGGVKGTYLRIINRSERPLIISWPTDISQNDLRLAADHSIGAIVASLIDGTTSAVVEGTSDAHLLVLKPESFSQFDMH